MSVILLEGPQCAGKSTLARAVVEELERVCVATHSIILRKQSGRANPDDSVYLPQLVADTSAAWFQKIAVWDRGWPSEYVYGTILEDGRPLAMDPWLGEWNYGRLVDANGLKVMLLGPPAHILQERRNSTDYDIDPVVEQNLYAGYAKRFGYHSPWGVEDHTPESMAYKIVNQFMRTLMNSRTDIAVGPADASTIYLGQATASIGRVFGENALKMRWATKLTPLAVSEYTTTRIIKHTLTPNPEWKQFQRRLQVIEWSIMSELRQIADSITV